MLLALLSVSRPAASGEIPSFRKRITLNISLLRDRIGGSPVAGKNEQGARDIVRFQVGVAREIFAQCSLDVVLADETRPVLVNPPGPCLLAVGEKFGLPASGGEVRLVVDHQKQGPIKLKPGSTPEQTALTLGRYLKARGFQPYVTKNAKRGDSAFPTADVLIRRVNGTLARVEPWPDHPMTTDRQQSIEIGEVDLSDGLEAYNEESAKIGTIEERTLIKALEDFDPKTIDVFVVNKLEVGKKQGESFVQGSNSSLANAIVLDLRALATTRQSYTLSHELGHVLLNDLSHPDDDKNVSSVTRLMHSDSSSALDGPNRLTREECKRILRSNLVLSR